MRSWIFVCAGKKKIVNHRETYKVSIAHHNPNGPISTIAFAHVMAEEPNFFRQETDVPWRDTVLDAPLAIRDDFFELNHEPGLGFDLLETEIKKHGFMRRCAGFYV